MRSPNPFRLLPLALLGLLGLHSSQASAFAEDVCFPEGGGPAQNCSTLPPACLPVGTEDPACKVASTKAFVFEGSKTVGARSTVHADATHLLAQSIGFSAEEAYWIAAYDELVDYGVFEPYDLAGKPAGGGTLKTATMNGFVRTNVLSGGMLYHYHATYHGGAAQPAPGLDGLQPDPAHPETEVFLAHLRAWVRASSGAERPVCAGGLTPLSATGDYATGSGCYTEADGGGAPLRGAISLFGSTAVPFDNVTGYQVLNRDDGGAPLLSPEFDNIVGGNATRAFDARLGIYLHALGDRISHHVCLDQSILLGPSPGPDSGWYEDMTNDECVQGIHALRHMWETGVDFSLLKPQDRTTEAALSLVYDELVAAAQLRNTLKAGASDPATKSSVTAGVAAALQIPGAEQRIKALASFACAQGLVPFPGGPACEDAGTIQDAAVDSAAEALPADSAVSSDVQALDVSTSDAAPAQPGASSASNDSGCSCSVAGRLDSAKLSALVAALALGVLFRRRRCT